LPRARGLAGGLTGEIFEARRLESASSFYLSGNQEIAADSGESANGEFNGAARSAWITHRRGFAFLLHFRPKPKKPDSSMRVELTHVFISHVKESLCRSNFEARIGF